MALDFSKMFAMLGAVGEEVLVRLPAQVVEEPFEGAGHLDAVVILEGLVELCDHLLEAVLRVRD